MWSIRKWFTLHLLSKKSSNDIYLYFSNRINNYHFYIILVYIWLVNNCCYFKFLLNNRIFPIAFLSYDALSMHREQKSRDEIDGTSWGSSLSRKGMRYLDDLRSTINLFVIGPLMLKKRSSLKMQPSDTYFLFNPLELNAYSFNSL